ncbi:MAG: zinc-regulated TonB-dependent outer membrane receptor [Candidatus Sericytochromatia bacterium]|nr:zinc-regulated TonB-dependent outer membrane receptor [Candidatus Sericytochromatia bacterium]
MGRLLPGILLGFCLSATALTARAHNHHDDNHLYQASVSDTDTKPVSGQDLEDIGSLFPGQSDAAGSAQPAPAASSDPNAQGLNVTRFFQSMNPDMSFIMDSAVAGFSSDTPLQLGAHDPRANGFNFQQLELSLGSAVDPYFRFDSNIVFSPFGVEIEEAYATTTALPENLQLRAGQFLTRFGRLNATHPHAWDFADQPLVNGKFFGGEGNRGLGTEVSWLSPLPWYLELAGSLTDATGAATARSFYGSQNLGVNGVGDLELCTLIKQFFPLSEDLSVAWGMSGAFGPNPTGRSNRSEIYGTDLYIKYRPISGENVSIVSLTTEAMVRRRQVPGNVLVDAGGYTSLFWQFALGWAAAARYEVVSGTNNDYIDPEWIGNRQRASANVTWWPTEFSRIRLQANADFPTWRAEPIYGVFLAFEVVTGAHGAHKF